MSFFLVLYSFFLLAVYLRPDIQSVCMYVCMYICLFHAIANRPIRNHISYWSNCFCFKQPTQQRRKFVVCLFMIHLIPNYSNESRSGQLWRSNLHFRLLFRMLARNEIFFSRTKQKTGRLVRFKHPTWIH